jgi:hypothetical protein
MNKEELIKENPLLREENKKKQLKIASLEISLIYIV